MGMRRSVLFLIVLSSLSACTRERRFIQPNSAMEPTVFQNEKFAVDTAVYRKQAPSRGDVIVFKHDGLLMLKRVIALSSETIEGKDFEINLNGTIIQENYIQHTGKKPITEEFSFLRTFKPVKVPAEYVFVMGDNRDYSGDSRDPNFGSVSVRDIVGKAVRIVSSDQPHRDGIAIR